MVSCAVIDEMRDKESVSLDMNRYEETTVRVTPVPYALAVADDWMILTLPELDGAWPSAKIVSETDGAISWARDLFAHLWADATPIEMYLADH
ncbi:protein of unknown function [Haloarcula vallismortis]|uniref:Methanogenesis regulatory protein FilR1 middle domain-containing protein n=1 Tax=Haloarcula vallismortis TaxID=28442 RepID=A0A1H2TZQ7_HALVA|nr:transcriptional regulator FilR1 domain-containing protein [Haloarcula vallismortis]SDW49217.1 protein of unknown function [Haloarcula vallismortis]